LDDILTAQKNGVVAINTLNQTWIDYIRRQHGASTSKSYAAKALIVSGSGYAVTVSVVKAGTTVGYLYDALSTESLTDESKLVAIIKEEGVYRADCQFTKGLVVVPGTEQAVTITYSMD
jgi:hypothetical protein